MQFMVKQAVVEIGPLSLVEPDGQVDEFGCVVADNADMQRMGRKQEMKRVYRQFSLISFTLLSTGTWEYLLLGNSLALENGGRAGLFWSFVWTVVGFVFVTASLAEMASMAPAAGGQYHWVSEFAPRQCQRTLSYISGWLSFLSWQAGTASGIFACGTIIQSLIAFCQPDYSAQRWQGFLFVMPVALVCTVVNLYGGHIMPTLQNAIVLLHFYGLLAFVVVFWALGPHVSPTEALTTFSVSGGWENVGVAVMVGQLNAIFAFTGYDAAAHMAEEVQNASETVPKAMMYTTGLNALLGGLLVVSYVFCIPSVEDALADSSGFPFLHVLKLCVPPPVVVLLSVVLMVNIQTGNIAYLASAARITFAFARDGGLPFAGTIGQINATLALPVNAVLLTSMLTILFSVIYVGSAEAYTAIISLASSAQIAVFFIAIACLLYKRKVAPETVPKSAWSLGKYGATINIIALLYLGMAFFWVFWPCTQEVDARSMNWALVMFVGVFLIAAVDYFSRARKVFVGPVEKTEAWTKEK